MLHLITGRSGSGKTTEIYRRLKQLATEERPLFLLVPEQASYENERVLLTELGPVLSQRVQVISFTRMVSTVAREIGGLTGKRMSSTLSLLLMSQALHSVADSLVLYRRHVESPEYLQALTDILAECKQCVITPLTLEESAAALPEGLLRKKLSELALIFGAYEALVAQASLVDPQDDLTWLADKLHESHIFDGASVFVDGFKGFTYQEERVLEQLMPRVDTLTVALCTDRATVGENDEFDRFSTAIRTAQQLRDACRSEVKITRLDTNRRTADPALQALEAGCFAAGTAPYTEPTQAVTIAACDDRVEECRYAARLIRRLLREEGGYCRDFTVVTHESDQYTDILETALRREGLPCCRDYREPVQTQPLITLVESALAAVTGGWDSDDLLRMIKTGLVGFSAASGALLENYVFLWNIQGRRWCEPFTEHPEGIGKEVTPLSESRLQYVNLLRRRLVRPLENFAKRLSGLHTGHQFAQAVYALLAELRVARCVRLRVAKLDADREHALADHQARLWEYVMELLDTFATGLAETRLSAARFAELFRLAVSSDDLGSIPQGLDGVVIGTVDRIRYTQPHTVIVLGANEGVLPAYPSAHGLLTDYERQRLKDIGVNLADNADRQTAEERFYAYAAVAAPSKRLVVTYHRKNVKDQAFPSSLVAEIKRLLPALKESDPAAVAAESEEDAFATFAVQYRDNTAEAASYREVFRSLPSYAGRLEAMDRLEEGFAFREPAVARKLFGEMMSISPSRAEEFYRCRFKYFCNYGLHLKQRKPATVDSANVGTMAHDLLQTTLPVYCENGIQAVTHEQVIDDTKRFIADYADTNFGDKEHRSARFEAMLGMLTAQCEYYVWRVVRELQQSRFQPVDYELPIGFPNENGDCVPAWRLTLPNGKQMLVNGQIDRVDLYKNGEQTFLRIVDYKTSHSKTFDIANVLSGVDVQLMIYLFALCENGGARYNADLTPAGVFYLPSKLPEIKLLGSAPEDKIESEKLRTMRSSGLVLDDPEVIRAMEADAAGIFIPVEYNDKGELKLDSLVTLEEFGKIRRHIEALLVDMVNLLHQGDIAALPQETTYMPCTYCAYHDICGREKNDPAKEFTAMSIAEAMAAMKEVEDDG